MRSEQNPTRICINRKESPRESEEDVLYILLIGPIHVCITFWGMANAVREQWRRICEPTLETVYDVSTFEERTIILI